MAVLTNMNYSDASTKSWNDSALSSSLWQVQYKSYFMSQRDFQTASIPYAPYFVYTTLLPAVSVPSSPYDTECAVSSETIPPHFSCDSNQSVYSGQCPRKESLDVNSNFLPNYMFVAPSCDFVSSPNNPIAVSSNAPWQTTTDGCPGYCLSYEIDESSGCSFSVPSPITLDKEAMSFYNYYQRLDVPALLMGKPRLLRTEPEEGEMTVGDLWNAHMKLLFRNLPHTWTLEASGPSTSQFGPEWIVFRDLAKVRFYCKNCNDGWTSMYGSAVFFYRLEYFSCVGSIFYQISGQKCCHCVLGTFEQPIWYPEEAQKVITNLYYDIATRIYHLKTPRQITARRMGQPGTNHNNVLCQGCQKGLCKKECLIEEEIWNY